MVNPRQYLAGELKPLLPKGWKIVPHAVALDTISEPVVKLQQVSVQPTASAPLSFHTVTIAVIIISPITNADNAEDSVDEMVNELLFALDEIPSLSWTEATKDLYGDSNLAYRVDIEINIEKKG